MANDGGAGFGKAIGFAGKFLSGALSSRRDNTGGPSIGSTGQELINESGRIVSGENPKLSLSDRIRRGFNVAAPALGVASRRAESEGIEISKSREELNAFRAGQAPILTDDLFPADFEDEEREETLNDFRQAGILQTDDQGRTFITRSDLQERGDDFFQDPTQQLQLMDKRKKGINRRLESNKALRDKTMEGLVNKAAKTKGMDPKFLTDDAKRALSIEMEKTPTPEMEAFKQNEQLLQQKLIATDSRIDQINKLQSTPLEAAKAAKLSAEAANIKADNFESTRTFETLSRGMFNGKSISQLKPEQVDSVVRRQLREDPLKLQQTMDLRKEFNSIDSIKQFDATETRFNQINGMLEATVSGDLKTRNTVDQVLINNFNKMMDESSVVRESEYARTPEGISLINRVKGAFQQKITGGSGLTDEDRRDIQTAARILQEQWLVTARKKASEYILIAEAQGTDPSLIVTNPLLRSGGVNKDIVDTFMNK